MLRIEASVAGETLIFDRSTGRLDGASAFERVVLTALQAGSVITQPFGHRGYRLGCQVLGSITPKRDIIVRLNDDAAFAILFCDGYWSRLLNRSHHYEVEIEICSVASRRTSTSSSTAAPTLATGQFSRPARLSACSRRSRSKHLNRTHCA